MGITQVPAYVPPDTSSRLTALESSDALITFMSNATSVTSGGGVLGVDSGYNIKWSQRFIVMGAGRSATIAPEGCFNIDMPAVGTVIPRVGGGAASVTVTAAGINLDPWDCVYYILPIGGAAATVPGNFRLVQYLTNLTIPVNWLPVAVRNSDGAFSIIRWCNGVNQGARIYVPTLNAPFTNYAAPWAQVCYYMINTRVYFEGLINLNGGTSGSTIFTVPVGMRSAQDLHSTAHAAAAHGAVNCYRDGRIVYNTGPTYISLDEVSYQACG